MSDTRDLDTRLIETNRTLVFDGQSVSYPGTNQLGDLVGGPSDPNSPPSYPPLNWLNKVNRFLGRVFNARGQGALGDGTTVAQLASAISPYWMPGGVYTEGRIVLHNGTQYHCSSTHTATSANKPGVGSEWVQTIDAVMPEFPGDAPDLNHWNSLETTLGAQWWDNNGKVYVLNHPSTGPRNPGSIWTIKVLPDAVEMQMTVYPSDEKPYIYLKVAPKTAGPDVSNFPWTQLWDKDRIVAESRKPVYYVGSFSDKIVMNGSGNLGEVHSSPYQVLKIPVSGKYMLICMVRAFSDKRYSPDAMVDYWCVRFYNPYLFLMGSNAADWGTGKNFGSNLDAASSKTIIADISAGQLLTSKLSAKMKGRAEFHFEARIVAYKID